MRDRALTFIRTLIIDEFGKKDGENILRKLGSGSLHFGLPIAASARIMVADSNSFPLREASQCRRRSVRLIPILTLSNPWLPSRGVRWT
jgi:hypothetical protein